MSPKAIWYIKFHNNGEAIKKECLNALTVEETKFKVMHVLQSPAMPEIVDLHY